MRLKELRTYIDALRDLDGNIEVFIEAKEREEPARIVIERERHAAQEGRSFRKSGPTTTRVVFRPAPDSATGT